MLGVFGPEAQHPQPQTWRGDNLQLQLGGADAGLWGESKRIFQHLSTNQNQITEAIEMDNWLVVWNMNFIFPYIGNNHPNWLIFFRGVQTTNQTKYGYVAYVQIFFFCDPGQQERYLDGHAVWGTILPWMWTAFAQRTRNIQYNGGITCVHRRIHWIYIRMISEHIFRWF